MKDRIKHRCEAQSIKLLEQQEDDEFQYFIDFEEDGEDELIDILYDSDDIFETTREILKD